jgi:hypothetical protein
VRAAAVLVSALISASAWASGPERIGLFVGSNGAPMGREPLRHAESDAIRLRRVFVDVGAMGEADATLLLGPNSEQLGSALRDLAARAADHPDAMVVFYYSGHADERALLLGRSQLRLDALRAALEGVQGRLGLHIVDACRAGSLVRSKGARRGARFKVDVHPKATGRAVIASSAAFEDSQESDRLGGSFFTLHLASGLRGAADRDRDGQVTLGEAYEYVYARTVESTRATAAGPQHPTYRYDLRGRGDTVLTWVGHGTARAASLTLGAQGDYLVVDVESGRVVAEVEPRSAGERLALRPATYRLSRRDADALFEGRVTLAPGESVAADTRLTERVEYARLVRKGGSGASATLWLEGGARTGLDAGIGGGSLGRVALAIHLPWFTVRPRFGVGRGLDGAEQQTPRLTYELATLEAGLEVRRAVDLAWLTLSGGLVGEGLRFTQSETAEREPDRTAWGFGFGVVAGVESPPLGPVSVALNGELTALSYPATEVDRAPADAGRLQTVLTGRLTLGVGYAF